jgi:tetratricopeptide (TPR) repeat protein
VFQGEVLFKKQYYEQAVGKYREALGNFPPHSGGRFLVYNKMGIAYEKLERFTRAIEVYEQGVKEGTITPFTYQRLANLYLDSDKLKKALDYCKAGTRCLKRSKTDFFQEIYFWFSFQKLKRKIRRRQKQIGGV